MTLEVNPYEAPAEVAPPAAPSSERTSGVMFAWLFVLQFIVLGAMPGDSVQWIIRMLKLFAAADVFLLVRLILIYKIRKIPIPSISGWTTCAILISPSYTALLARLVVHWLRM